MRSTLSITALAAFSLLPAAYANFDAYRVELSRPYAQGGDRIGWQIFEAEASCESAGNENRPWWDQTSDVSGDKLGFRCVGDGCFKGGIAEDINILEMNFDQTHHYSEFPFMCPSSEGDDLPVDGGLATTAARLTVLLPAIYKDYDFNMIGCEFPSSLVQAREDRSGCWLISCSGWKSIRTLHGLPRAQVRLSKK